jgi:FlaA1/EpsC-like NDP-sugar epimerase
MGATKRLGECFIRNLNSAGGCKFVSVRFGNVLGSSGSVVPVFQEQILAGGPVTVTDPRMTRYFMLPSEAVQLVLQAASLGEGGKTYVLDMGEPVSIEQLARDMIRLLGHVPDRDIRIVHTGIRPGEKLHEELYFPGHQQETRFSGTWEDNYVPPNALPATSENLRRLVALARKGKASEALRLLKELVPDFEPMYPETRQLLSSREAP